MVEIARTNSGVTSAMIRTASSSTGMELGVDLNLLRVPLRLRSFRTYSSELVSLYCFASPALQGHETFDSLSFGIDDSLVFSDSFSFLVIFSSGGVLTYYTVYYY